MKYVTVFSEDHSECHILVSDERDKHVLTDSCSCDYKIKPYSGKLGKECLMIVHSSLESPPIGEGTRLENGQSR